MSNPFEGRTPDLSGPATDLVPVTPNDGSDLPVTAVALYVESSGAVVFDSVVGTTRTVQVTDFAILPVSTRRVRATGTTATGIHPLVLV